MPNVNLVINETDTLATGKESNELSNGYGRRYRKAILLNEADVIGGDFRDLNEHLRRLLGQNTGWSYVELRTTPYQRRYMFDDSSVQFEDVTIKPLTPSGVAALVGKDPYTTPGDINFLIKGDRFRAERSLPGGRKEVAYGTADMDGHAISPNYGWMIFELEGDTRTATVKRNNADDPKTAYINVHWDHREPGDYDNSVQAHPRRGSVPAVEYKPSGEHWPNEGLNLKDGWSIWVLPEVAKRKRVRIAEHADALMATKVARERAEAARAVEAAKRALADAERKLAGLS